MVLPGGLSRLWLLPLRRLPRQTRAQWQAAVCLRCCCLPHRSTTAFGCCPLTEEGEGLLWAVLRRLLPHPTQLWP